MLKSLENDSHVKTRIAQYEALDNGKGIAIAKQLVKSKVAGENLLLRKYGLRPLDNPIENVDSGSLESIKKRFMVIESQCARLYFQQIFSLISEKIRPENRNGFKAYDGVNNLFNLGYEMLSWKTHKALVNAKLEPYLGFLHSEQFGKPSLVCDFMEIYRYLVDDFLIEFCRDVHKKDFVTKPEAMSKGKIGKREYLNDLDTRSLMNSLNEYFEMNVEIPRIRFGKRQTLETLISEEALLLAQYLRNEMQDWNPRTPHI
jgi:CRISPR-associated protein Cas1